MAEAAALEQELARQYSYSYSIEFANSPIDKIRAKLAPSRFRLAAGRVVEALKVQPSDKVLEIGSGLGLLGKEVKKIMGAKLQFLGIDLCFNSLSKSKGYITPVEADAGSLPFARDSFDKIVSTDVLEHVPNARKAVAEVFRVLKPGGLAFLVIADPVEGRFSEVKDHIKRSQEKTDVGWWEGLFEEGGFKVLPEASKKHRKKDWRRIFNLPFLVKLKDKPGFACAFNPVYRPGTYILKKPS